MFLAVSVFELYVTVWCLFSLAFYSVVLLEDCEHIGISGHVHDLISEVIVWERDPFLDLKSLRLYCPLLSEGKVP